MYTAPLKICRVVLLLLRQRHGAAGSSLSTTFKYLRRTTSGAAGSGLGTTIKYLPSAAGIDQGATMKLLRHTARQRPGHNDQLPVIHNERRRGQRPRRYLVAEEFINRTGPAKLWSWWRGGPSKGNARHRSKHAATPLPPAGSPKANAEVLCQGESTMHQADAKFNV